MTPSPPSPFQPRLDFESGVPVYRQIMDQIHGAMASGALRGGDQLPTVRQLSVDLAVNPNTVVRAYRELEIRGVLTTQQGIGTFISAQRVAPDAVERQRRLTQLVGELVAKAGAEGFALEDVAQCLSEFLNEPRSNP
jgi:GntR family transcriptional regulator